MKRLAARSKSVDRTRVAFGSLSLGYAMTSITSFWGYGPHWPNEVTLGSITALASISMLLFTINYKDEWRRLAIAAAIIAGVSRMIGWALSSNAAWQFRIGAVGTSIALVSSIVIINYAVRRGL